MIYYKSRIVKSKPVSYQVDGEELLKMFARTPSSDSFDRNFFSSDFFDGKIFDRLKKSMEQKRSLCFLDC